MEHCQSPGEGHDKEHRRQYCRIISLPCDEKSEDQAGAGGQDNAPGEHDEAGGLDPAIHAPFQQGPRIYGDECKQPAVQHNIPGKYRGQIEIGCSDDNAVRTAKVQHQHGQSSGQQCDREHAGQRRTTLVHGFAEYRADGCNVEYAGSRDNHEYREHMRHTPDDLVVHAGDDMAVFLHHVCRKQPHHRN